MVGISLFCDWDSLKIRQSSKPSVFPFRQLSRMARSIASRCSRFKADTASVAGTSSRGKGKLDKWPERDLTLLPKLSTIKIREVACSISFPFFLGKVCQCDKKVPNGGSRIVGFSTLFLTLL